MKAISRRWGTPSGERAGASSRRSTASVLGCEALEGRALLSMAHFGHAMGFGFARGGRFAQFGLRHGGAVQVHQVSPSQASPGGATSGVAFSTSSSTTASTAPESGTVSNPPTDTTATTPVTPASGSTGDPAPPSGAPVGAPGPMGAPGDGLAGELLTALTGGVGIGGGLMGPGDHGPTVLVKGSTGTGAQGGSTGSAGASKTAMTDFKTLQSDLLAIQEKSQVTLGQLATLRSDFESLQAASTSAPDQTKLSTLQSDLQAIGNALPTDAQVQQIQSDFSAVVQSEGVTDQTLITRAFSDVQAVGGASNITADDVAKIAADRKAIQTDLGTTGAPSTSSNSPGTGLFPGGPMGGPMAGAMGGGSRGWFANRTEGANGAPMSLSRGQNGGFAGQGGRFFAQNVGSIPNGPVGGTTSVAGQGGSNGGGLGFSPWGG